MQIPLHGHQCSPGRRKWKGSLLPWRYNNCVTKRHETRKANLRDTIFRCLSKLQVHTRCWTLGWGSWGWGLCQLSVCWSSKEDTEPCLFAFVMMSSLNIQVFLVKFFQFLIRAEFRKFGGFYRTSYCQPWINSLSSPCSSHTAGLFLQPIKPCHRDAVASFKMSSLRCLCSQSQAW